jgi:hypothetical protein
MICGFYWWPPRAMRSGEQTSHRALVPQLETKTKIYRAWYGNVNQKSHGKIQQISEFRAVWLADRRLAACFFKICVLR